MFEKYLRAISKEVDNELDFLVLLNDFCDEINFGLISKDYCDKSNEEISETIDGLVKFLDYETFQSDNFLIDRIQGYMLLEEWIRVKALRKLSSDKVHNEMMDFLKTPAMKAALDNLAEDMATFNNVDLYDKHIMDHSVTLNECSDGINMLTNEKSKTVYRDQTIHIDISGNYIEKWIFNYNYEVSEYTLRDRINLAENMEYILIFKNGIVEIFAIAEHLYIMEL